MRRLINRLKIQHKLALLCSAFLLPIGFLTFLLVANTQKDVSFAAEELQGIAYIAALKSELEHVVALAYGAGSSADLASAQAGVLSFSKLRDDILMWAHYGDKHRGLCLEFDGSPNCIFSSNFIVI